MENMKTKWHKGTRNEEQIHEEIMKEKGKYKKQKNDNT